MVTYIKSKQITLIAALFIQNVTFDHSFVKTKGNIRTFWILNYTSKMHYISDKSHQTKVAKFLVSNFLTIIVVRFVISIVGVGKGGGEESRVANYTPLYKKGIKEIRNSQMETTHLHFITEIYRSEDFRRVHSFSIRLSTILEKLTNSYNRLEPYGSLLMLTLFSMLLELYINKILHF